MQLPDPVIEQLRRKRKVEAIKLLREAEGVSLTEAKEAVEIYLKEHPYLAAEEIAQQGSASQKKSLRKYFWPALVLVSFTWMFINLADLAGAVIVSMNLSGYREAEFVVEKVHYSKDDEGGLMWGLDGSVEGEAVRFFAPELADEKKPDYPVLVKKYPQASRVKVLYNPKVTKTLFQRRSLHVLPFTTELQSETLKKITHWFLFCLLPFLTVLFLAAKRDPQKRNE